MQKAAFTIREAAHEAAMSPRTIYRRLKAGDLKARKSNRKTLILAEDLKNWLANLPVADLEAA
jgi:excisionase family DNA binding protein